MRWVWLADHFVCLLLLIQDWIPSSAPPHTGAGDNEIPPCWVCFALAWSHWIPVPKKDKFHFRLLFSLHFCQNRIKILLPFYIFFVSFNSFCKLDNNSFTSVVSSCAAVSATDNCCIISFKKCWRPLKLLNWMHLKLLNWMHGLLRIIVTRKKTYSKIESAFEHCRSFL